MNKIENLLEQLNPTFLDLSDYIESEINRLNKKFPENDAALFCEKDTILITYADQFKAEGKNNLQSLRQFVEDDLESCTSIVHILPFYPWTSDDGFSPTDYKEVCSDYGSWSDIEIISQKIMVDCVFNHLSSENEFFQRALAGNKSCEEMFHVYDEKTYSAKRFQDDIPNIVRPRTSPLFSEYSFSGERKYVWTTFSKDQVDTNLNNINMLKYILESFFLYIDKGSKYFRVDAVPFMWKEMGTNCSHLEKTHVFVQLFRAITDRLSTKLILITESNVPHIENISYWGDGANEAHMIYNFSLAPLILHGVLREESKYLNEWAKEVFNIPKSTTFLNFTATHDGIGMRGLEGIVPDEEVSILCDIALKKGGHIGKKTSRDGTVRPYELNITWGSIMGDFDLDDESYIRKVVNSHAIVMFFPGIGAHYVHNFLGTQNWIEGYEQSGIARRLNRKKLNLPLGLGKREEMIKRKLIDLIKLKNSNPLFSPNKDFEIQNIHSQCICFKRFDESNSVMVYFNLSSKEVSLCDFKLKPYELRLV